MTNVRSAKRRKVHFSHSNFWERTDSKKYEYNFFPLETPTTVKIIFLLQLCVYIKLKVGRELRLGNLQSCWTLRACCLPSYGERSRITGDLQSIVRVGTVETRGALCTVSASLEREVARSAVYDGRAVCVRAFLPSGTRGAVCLTAVAVRSWATSYHRRCPRTVVRVGKP